LPSLPPPSVPSLEDAAKIACLAREITELDRYSPYLYLVLCERFADTCAVALDELGECRGFVTGLRDPRYPDTLFVWQVGVRQDTRGQGLGARMLRAILARPAQHGFRFVETTVSPGNLASQRMFAALARELRTECATLCGYPASLFPEPHEPEPLWRIGPFEWRSR
jgi:L-2,4-diaminobutyric acid acetyltransferase